MKRIGIALLSDFPALRGRPRPTYSNRGYPSSPESFFSFWERPLLVFLIPWFQHGPCWCFHQQAIMPFYEAYSLRSVMVWPPANTLRNKLNYCSTRLKRATHIPQPWCISIIVTPAPRAGFRWYSVVCVLTNHIVHSALVGVFTNKQ
jgi:hypothetical protein